MSIKKYGISIVLFFALAFIYPLQSMASRAIEAVGSAPVVNQASQLAREQAIKNAMRQASLQVSAKIDSTSTISQNVLIIDSTRVNSSSTVEDVKILEEWQDQGLYFVRIRAQVPEKAKQKSPSPAAGYRKKVAAIQFHVRHRNQIQDLPNIERELPIELLRRLENSANYLGVDGTDYLIPDGFSGRERDVGHVISKIANKLGAQIVIAGVIRDFGVSEGFLFDSRRAETEVFIFDGISGVKLATHRFSERIDDASYLPPDTALFSNAEFNRSRFGEALNRIVNRQAELIGKDLNRIPFSARILRAEGKTIYFDAGNTSLVRVGDTLMAYRLEPDPVQGVNDRFLGYREEPVATMVVKKVQPAFSIGELETKNTLLYAGDLIRFGW